MVFIHLEIPKDKKVQITSSIVQIADVLSDLIYEGALDPNVYHNQEQWQITDTLKGDTTKIKGLFGTLSHGKSCGMKTHIRMPKAETLKVRVPTFIVNNKEISLPDITFNKVKAAEILSPINC